MPSGEIQSRSDGLKPSLAELIALRERVRGWPPARLGAASVSGPALSPFRGRGMEYAESRPYAAGDDARHIDWRLTARSGRTHTKLFQAERERITVLVADTAPVLADPLSIESVAQGRLAALAAHHDLLVLLLSDPLELEPPRGLMPFANEGVRVELDLATRELQAAWRQQFALRIDTQSQRLHLLGAGTRTLRTDDDPETLLRTLLPTTREVAA